MQRSQREFFLMVLAICLVLFGSACSGYENVVPEVPIYVSEKTGDDQKGDGTEHNPWKTIGKGISELGKDKKHNILVIRGGFYHVPNQIRLRRSGSAKRPLVIKAASGEKVLISNEKNGVSNDVKEHIFNIKRDDSYKGLEYITIKGICFVGGIIIGGSSQTCKGIHIENCTFTARGINLGPHNPNNVSLIYLRSTEDCSIRNCTLFYDDPRRNENFDGIKIWRDTKRLVVENNEIYGLVGKGIDNKHGMPDQELVIRNNYIHHLNHRAITVNGNRTVVENNVIYRCPVGINVWKESGSPGGSFSVIDHNTIVDCRTGIALAPESTAKLYKCRVTNNILVNYGKEPFGALNITPYRKEPYVHGHYSNYNCFYHIGGRRYVRDRDKIRWNLHEWQAVSGLDTESIEKDPGFRYREGTSLCDFRVSEEFSVAREALGDDGFPMGANIVSTPDGGCRLAVYTGDEMAGPTNGEGSNLQGAEGTGADAPRPPRNVRAIAVQ